MMMVNALTARYLSLFLLPFVEGRRELLVRNADAAGHCWPKSTIKGKNMARDRWPKTTIKGKNMARDCWPKTTTNKKRA
jgi:hypothetical protein